VVLIAKGDQILTERAYGKADFQHNLAMQLGTRFRIASLSKTFTAAAIELLVARGGLSLKDPLSKYLSGIRNGDKITIEQLLTHESGVGQLDTADMYRDCLTNEEIIRRLRITPPSFSPGTNSRHSNEGYFLLAIVIEKVAGISYAAFLQKEMFDPLGLANTGSACKELPPGPNATGHVPDAKADSVTPLPFNEAAMIGPGSL
jgi:CubicO group peptidase (beta-lactamase class C family)